MGEETHERAGQIPAEAGRIPEEAGGVNGRDRPTRISPALPDRLRGPEKPGFRVYNPTERKRLAGGWVQP